MVAGPLVDRLIDSGERLVKLLDEAGIAPSAALWVLRPESEDWNLVLATETATKHGPKAAYQELLTVFRQHEAELDPLLADDIVIIEAKHVLIRQHLSLFGAASGISRIRSSGNAINGQMLPDALIYRLVASPNGK